MTVRIVLATVLGYPAAVRVGPDPEAPVRVRNRQATRTGWQAPGCYQDRTYTHGFSPRLELARGFNIAVPTTLAAIKYLSSDHIKTCAVSRLCSSLRALSSRIQIHDPTDIRWVAVEKGLISSEIRGFSIATQRVLVGSQIWNREVQERLELHILRTDHVTIRSGLKYLIGAKVVVLKCRAFGGKTGPIATVRVFVW